MDMKDSIELCSWIRTPFFPIVRNFVPCIDVYQDRRPGLKT